MDSSDDIICGQGDWAPDNEGDDEIDKLIHDDVDSVNTSSINDFDEKNDTIPLSHLDHTTNEADEVFLVIISLYFIFRC